MCRTPTSNSRARRSPRRRSARRSTASSGLRYVSDGAFITAATRVATLQRLDRLKIDFSLPEKYAGRIKPKSPVTFSVAGGDRRFKGEIYAQDPRIDAATRTVLVRAWCDNPGARLLPGASASVELVLAELGEAILVPSVAVIPGLNELNVYVVGEDHKAERRAVEAGTRLESTVHILSGLEKGDVVITSGSATDAARAADQVSRRLNA